MRLINQTKNAQLAAEVEEAKTFRARAVGLLGRSYLETGRALWIHRCNSIHTLFMKFSIDCVFVNKNLEVRQIHLNIPPGRVIFPVWTAISVFELSAKSLNADLISKGDRLELVR